jgi:hypothetical protein
VLERGDSIARLSTAGPWLGARIHTNSSAFEYKPQRGSRHGVIAPPPRVARSHRLA